MERTVAFPEPTDATNVMPKAIREQIDSLFVNGARCRKPGIVFFGLEKAGAAYQADLFSPAVKREKSKLSKRATTRWDELLTVG